MRLLLDTNVVASGLLWDGAPARLIDAARLGDVELVTSRALLGELARILGRAKFARAIAATGLSGEELVVGYGELTTVLKPAPIPPTIAADPSDDQVLACAVAAEADFIVSGDRHLLGLGGQYQGIPIVAPAEMLAIICGA